MLEGKRKLIHNYIDKTKENNIELHYKNKAHAKLREVFSFFIRVTINVRKPFIKQGVHIGGYLCQIKWVCISRRASQCGAQRQPQLRQMVISAYKVPLRAESPRHAGLLFSLSCP